MPRPGGSFDPQRPAPGQPPAFDRAPGQAQGQGAPRPAGDDARRPDGSQFNGRAPVDATGPRLDPQDYRRPAGAEAGQRPNPGEYQRPTGADQGQRLNPGDYQRPAGAGAGDRGNDGQRPGEQADFRRPADGAGLRRPDLRDLRPGANAQPVDAARIDRLRGQMPDRIDRGRQDAMHRPDAADIRVRAIGVDRVGDGRVVRTPLPGQRPTGYVRPYNGSRPNVNQVYRTNDHRYARPSYRVVRNYAGTTYVAPARVAYRPYYTRWWVHPWYRWTYATTCVVGFGFYVDPWSYTWAPPVRAGWSWVPGAYMYNYWTPGYWAPAAPVVGYTYVPGWWQGQTYVDGYYRQAARTDGDWSWVDGYYLDDGTYVRGHWMPNKAGPAGYTWEPGFWDGETWVEGFWRPEYRASFTWISSYYDEDGVFHSGYWMPVEAQPGFVWVPGWFDGNAWQEGYWVRSDEYEQTDPATWTPEPGWDDGWQVGSGWGDGEVLQNATPGPGADAPLAIPVPE